MTSREAILNTSVTAAVLLSMASNFLLNRALTFGDRTRQPLPKQFLMFIAVCLLGAIVNWFVTTGLARRWTDVLLGLQTAAVCGVLAGMVFNYLGSRLVVFRGSRAPKRR
jgi:dolichol-phosphate mannosyltransferase